MAPFPDDGTAVRRALVVTAHPDDVDFGAAGTVAAWTAAGVEVVYCICTSGDAGGFDASSREQMSQTRQDEQRAAARAVGVRDVRFLDHLDGRVTADLRLRRDITEVIRSVRPDRVLTHSPEINWANIALSHPDHRAVGEAALAAVYPDARNEHAHPELLERDLRPWSVTELWMSEATEERANRAVDITEHVEDKLAALAEHRSQVAHFDDLAGTMRRHLEDSARRHGMAAGRFAEAFHVVDTA